MGEYSVHGIGAEIQDLMESFGENHRKSLEKNNKSAARRARTDLGKIKKLVPEYRKASLEFVDSL